MLIRRALSSLIVPKTPRQALLVVSYITASILILFALHHIVGYIFTESYVWQCTTLADWIDPVARTTCNVYGYKSLYSVDRSKRHLMDTNKALKIGLLMLYNDQDGTWDQELMSRVLKNRDEYSRMHDYSIVVANDILDRSKPPAWTKLLAADKYLDKYDYLMYIDMDIVIMNMTVKAEHFIDMAPDKDMIMTEDWNGPNTGVWLVKKSAWSHWFLQTAFNQTQLVPKKSPEGISYPFEYEQRAVHYLLDTSIWRQRGLPKWSGDIQEIRSHFFFLPQCAMNSYIMYPFYWNGDREQSHYVNGDFMVHFAGKKGAIKTNLMSHFLTQAETS
ncbi:hypothetical protein EON65_16070 [archaeon]|nr:MAG: hypothetical protein EON65_16070 [archaeon]